MSDGFDASALYDEYRDEARQQLEQLDAALLLIEQEGGIPAERSAELLRALHTLKGNSGMLGFAAVRDAVHSVESVFKEPVPAWRQPVVDRLFEAAAVLRRAVEGVGGEDQDEAFARAESVPGMLAGWEEPASPGEAPGSAATAEEARPAVPGEVAEPAATGGEVPPGAPVEAPEPAAAGEEVEPAGVSMDERSASGGSELLRVPFRRLDELLAKVGELVTLGAALRQLVRRERDRLDGIGLRREFQDHSEQLDRLADELRLDTLELRLVPVGRLLARFPRLARDLARQQGKRVRVELTGEETGLDKSTVDLLGEPLLHLVRNAVDHGIETPREREAAGKPPEGRLRIEARRAGDQVTLTVEDDGRGLDLDAIRRRARESAEVEGGEPGPLEEPTPEELAHLIFMPGFTTRPSADALSGRGIGLDVVRRSVGGVRGSLRVERLEVGTRFLLALPLRVAIVPALVFESHGELLALAATDVVETIRRPSVTELGGVPVLRFRGETVPLHDPERLFQGGGAVADPYPPDDASRRPGARGVEGQVGGSGPDAEGAPDFAIIARSRGRSFALPARRLLVQEEIVVKGLPAYLGDPRGASGAAVLPGGRLALLLDPAELLDPRPRRPPRSA